MKMKEKSTNSQKQIYMGILAVFLAVAFCFLWGKVNVHAEEATYKGFYYETKEDGTIKITGYDTDQIDVSDGIFTIPSQIEGKDVTEIGDYAFGDYEFNSEIIQIKMPENLKVIRRNAFQYFIKVKKLEIPDSVTTLEEWAFYRFESIDKINLPASLEKYEGNAFESYSGSVQEFAISDSNTNYKVKDGVLYTKDCKTLLQVPYGKTEIDYPSGLTSIGNSAFSGNFSATIKIPDSVESIGKDAFTGSIVEEIYLPSKLNELNEWSFYGMYNLKKFVCDNKLENYTIVDGILYDKDITKIISVPGGVEEVNIPDTIKTIGSYSFYGDKVKKIELPEGVTKIEKKAFDTNNLREISLPSTLEEIESEAFLYCNLFSVKIPDKITRLKRFTFNTCSNLHAVYIPKSVTEIDEDTFVSCGEQLTIYTEKDSAAYKWAENYGYKVSTGEMPEMYEDEYYSYWKNADEPEWNIKAFEPVFNSKSYWKIPSSYKDIPVGRIEKSTPGGRGFSDDIAIDIPDTVKVIDEEAFSYLETSDKLYIRIPQSVTSIGETIFDDETMEKEQIISGIKEGGLVAVVKAIDGKRRAPRQTVAARTHGICRFDCIFK